MLLIDSVSIWNCVLELIKDCCVGDSSGGGGGGTNGGGGKPIVWKWFIVCWFWFVSSYVLVLLIWFFGLFFSLKNEEVESGKWKKFWFFFGVDDNLLVLLFTSDRVEYVGLDIFWKYVLLS